LKDPNSILYGCHLVQTTYALKFVNFKIVSAFKYVQCESKTSIGPADFDPDFSKYILLKIIFKY
jgi:hypothetical protein